MTSWRFFVHHFQLLDFDLKQIMHGQMWLLLLAVIHDGLAQWTFSIVKVWGF
jgi:hypothetical protein